MEVNLAQNKIKFLPTYWLKWQKKKKKIPYLPTGQNDNKSETNLYFFSAQACQAQFIPVTPTISRNWDFPIPKHMRIQDDGKHVKHVKTSLQTWTTSFASKGHIMPYTWYRPNAKA